MRVILYKIVSKLIFYLQKFQKVFKVNYSYKFLFKIVKDNSIFFSFKIKEFNVISPNREIVSSLYDQIFNKEVYKFYSVVKNPRILDCGSNIGMAIFYWKQLFPNCSIIAFEPSKSNFEALTHNVHINNIDNVQLINAALSSSEGFKKFTDNNDASGSLFLEKDLLNVYDVKTVRLDTYLYEYVDFLKIDIEGEEINLLDQIENHIDNIGNLFIEYHSFTSRPQELGKLFQMLERSSFRYYVEGEYSNVAPLCNDHINLNQDLQISIWAKKI